MGKKCFVPGCRSGYASERSQGKPSYAQFHPQDDSLEKWRRAIPRKDRVLQKSDTVCELHFADHLIVKEEVLKLPDGTTVIEKRRKHLKPDAVPHIFPTVPKYLTTRKMPRKSPKKRFGTGIRTVNKTTLVDNMQRKLGSILKSPLNLLRPEPEPSHTLDDIKKNPTVVSLPNNRWRVMDEENRILFVHTVTEEVFKVDRYVSLSKDPTCKTADIFFDGKLVKIEGSDVHNSGEIKKLIRRVENLAACPGSGIGNTRHDKCSFITPQLGKSLRCKFCHRLRRNLFKRQKNKERSKINREKKIKSQREKITRMKRKILSLRKEVLACQEKMKKITGEAVDKILESISEKSHKEVVKACIMSSKYANSKNRRYSNEWMYECILMRIKSGSLYRKMLRENTLPLPSLRTIHRYIQKLKPQFGFHLPTFKLMEKKAEHLSVQQRHGTLMVDEMALEEGVTFNKNNMTIHGFVNLGTASSPNSDSTLGDHALTFLFQPLQGVWFQALGAFCSRGAAKGPELEKLVTEAIILLENHGYYVDAVTTDGGAWNRNMWSLLGINSDNVSCPNPAQSGELVEDESMLRRLWFISDFPHLIKSIWSRVRNSKTLETPDGPVLLKHWEVLADVDDVRLRHINICPKLTQDHIHPTNFQSMNVKMAFQFFSEDIALAMEHYRDRENVTELENCHGTVVFIRKIHKLIKAMNSKDTWDSLQSSSENNARKVIVEFLHFLKKWKEEVKKPDLRLAHQTELGLMVSLKGTLELCDYLTKELDFKYLMTKRLNQDPLEHFFGRIREACGANTHPDPQQFCQVFRLLSIASLIKPPKGSNVTGGEMLESLTKLSDLFAERNAEKRLKLEEEIDNILDNGDENAPLEIQTTKDTYLDSVNNPHAEHVYNQNQTISGDAMQMFAGYVARKVRKFSTARICEACFQSLVLPPDEERIVTQQLIEKRSKGYLLTPSKNLFNFLFKVENTILTVLGESKLKQNILFEVVDKLKEANIESAVGCEVHKRDLSKATLMFYLNTRMIFACKRFMRKETQIQARKRKAKSLLKQHKLNAIPVSSPDQMITNVQNSCPKTKSGHFTAGQSKEPTPLEDGTQGDGTQAPQTKAPETNVPATKVTSPRRKRKPAQNQTNSAKKPKKSKSDSVKEEESQSVEESKTSRQTRRVRKQNKSNDYEYF